MGAAVVSLGTNYTDTNQCDRVRYSIECTQCRTTILELFQAVTPRDTSQYQGSRLQYVSHENRAKFGKIIAGTLIVQGRYHDGMGRLGVHPSYDMANLHFGGRDPNSSMAGSYSDDHYRVLPVYEQVAQDHSLLTTFLTRPHEEGGVADCRLCSRVMLSFLSSLASEICKNTPTDGTISAWGEVGTYLRDTRGSFHLYF